MPTAMTIASTLNVELLIWLRPRFQSLPKIRAMKSV